MSRRSPSRTGAAPPARSRNDGAASRQAAGLHRVGRTAHPLLDPRLWILLALSAVLAFLYARAIPIGGNPDEGAHLQFVKTVATEGRLPRLNLAERRRTQADISYEAHQPPLYYVLAAPFYRVGEALDQQEGAGQACRAFSVLIGLIGTVLVWLLAGEVAPDRPGLRLAATGLVALLPMRLAIMASVSNDALAEATSTLVLLLCVRAVRGNRTVRQWVWMGSAVSLALLSKQSNLMLLPVVALALLLAARRPAGEADRTAEGATPAAASVLLPGGIVAGMIVVLAGWWFLRNQVLYGDPLAKRAFDWYFADTWTWEKFRDLNGYTFPRYLFEKVIPTTFDSFWGAFGYLWHNSAGDQPFMGAYPTPTPAPPHWEYPPSSTVYPWLWIATALAAGGGALYWLRSRRAASAASTAPAAPAAVEGDGRAAGVGLLTLHTAFVAASFLRFQTQYFQAQGRYFFPALAAIALALAGGWMEWVTVGVRLSTKNDAQRVKRQRLGEAVVGWTVVAGMLILACYALYDTVIPFYLHS